jgi:hypothetical protein
VRIDVLPGLLEISYISQHSEQTCKESLVEGVYSKNLSHDMMRLLCFILGLIFFISCEKNKPDLTSSCAGYIRTEAVSNVPATVNRQRVNGQPTGNYRLVLDPISYSSYAQPLAVCNLPQQFQKDSLGVKVSGYYLTYPGFELMNGSALPFEIADIQLR